MSVTGDFKIVIWNSSIPGIEGEIELNRLSFIDKMNLVKELQMEIKETQLDDGKILREVTFKTDKYDQLIIMKKHLDRHVKRVNLKIGETIITQWDQLEYCDCFQDILPSLNEVLSNGVQLGKN